MARKDDSTSMRRKNVRPRNALRRVSALLLTLAILIGLMPQWSGEAQAASYMPVSYTHLDVYKRQPQGVLQLLQ